MGANSDGALRLDETDREILALLQQDASIPRTRIAELVGLSGPAVLERVRKLEDAGVIRGYATLLDSRRLGLDVTAFIGVSLQHPRHIAEIEHWVSAMPAVLECHHVTGDFTLLLKVKAVNTAGLEALLADIRSLDGVQRTVTMVALSTQSERVAVPLDALPKKAARAGAKR
jgi:Lrp/AsnC family leucine-responsive transcriptional regulator